MKGNMLCLLLTTSYKSDMRYGLQNSKMKIFLAICICALPAFYLLEVINEITLATLLQKIFVWCYLEVILSIVLLCIVSKVVYIFKDNKWIGIAITLLALVIGAVTSTCSLPQKIEETKMMVEILPEMNSESEGREVWINEIRVDGISKRLDSTKITDNGWILKDNSIYGEYNNSGRLELLLPKGKKYELKFGKHAWSGIIEVVCHDQKKVIDLYAPEKDTYVLELQGVSESYTGIYYCILVIGYCLWLLLLEMVCLYVLRRKKYINGGN